MSGLTPSRTAVPAMPTSAERMKPGFERSIRYHRTGLTRAKVKETCKVDCHGSFRYSIGQLGIFRHLSLTLNSR